VECFGVVFVAFFFDTTPPPTHHQQREEEEEEAPNFYLCEKRVEKVG